MQQISKLRGVQLKMLHKMLGARRRHGESMKEFMERINSKLKRLREANGFNDFDKLYHRSLFKWAGHVARMIQYDPGRPTLRILRHKDWDWIRSISKQFGSQLHGKRLHVWRWERHLYKFFGRSSWQEVAQDACLWHQRLDEMVSWRMRSC